MTYFPGDKIIFFSLTAFFELTIHNNKDYI